IPREENRAGGEQNDHAVRFGRAAGHPPAHRHCRKHPGRTVRVGGQRRPAWFHGDSVCVYFLLRQQRPELCQPECEHSVLQLHYLTSDDGGQVRLGDSRIGVGGSIWPSEKYSFVVGNASDPFFFVRSSTYNLFDNDGGSELSSGLGARSFTGTIAFR